jgi:hypothetical protein
LNIHATSNAISLSASYRPDEPPCPAAKFTLSRICGAPSFSSRRRATYFAGSQYITWLSLIEVFTSIAG